MNRRPVTPQQFTIGRMSLFAIDFRALARFCLFSIWSGRILPTASTLISSIAAFSSVLLPGMFEIVHAGSAQQQAGFLFVFLCMSPAILGCSASWNAEVLTGYRTVWLGGTHVSSNIKCTSRVYMVLINGAVRFGYWLIAHNVRTSHFCSIHDTYSDAILVDCCLLHTSVDTT